MALLSSDKSRYFEIQYLNSKKSIIPFIGSFGKDLKKVRILEIGSAEGGVLKAFTDMGCTCLGIELNPSRVDSANEFLKDEIAAGLIRFSAKNIYDNEKNEVSEKFDLIILKDVIEHIHDHERFMKEVERFLNPTGKIFFGFPSWRMPFGGHQQIAKSKLASKMPYYHILPRFIYKGILKACKENEPIINELMEIKTTRISTLRFERLCKKNNYKISKRIKYFIAPIYEYKFGYKSKKLWNWIGIIPWFNDFFTFQSYYLIKKK